MKKTTPITILGIVIFLLCLVVTLYPLISDAVNSRHQSKIYTEYLEEMENTDQQELAEALEAARAYNAALPSVQLEQDSLEISLDNYDDLLNIDGSGIMGYVSVPSIDVNLPIYHGTNADTLENGIGHLMGTSLPVGGKSTHCVLTGHTGMANQKLLTDLDQLKKGDVFYLKVLGGTLAYKVDSIHTVLPYETSMLRIVDGRDYCTLVTCTPYGINTHRLLVRGKRTGYKEFDEIRPTQSKTHKKSTSTWKSQYYTSLLLGLGAGGSMIAALFIVLWLKKRRKKNG